MRGIFSINEMQTLVLLMIIPKMGPWVWTCIQFSIIRQTSTMSSSLLSFQEGASCSENAQYVCKVLIHKLQSISHNVQVKNFLNHFAMVMTQSKF